MIGSDNEYPRAFISRLFLKKIDITFMKNIKVY